MSLLVPALIAAMMGAPAPVADVTAMRVSTGDRADVPIGAPGRLDADRIVCRKTLVLGAVRPKKVCLSAFAWAERQDAAQRTMDTTLWGQGAIKPPFVQRP
jgi:hypothetical protein